MNTTVASQPHFDWEAPLGVVQKSPTTSASEEEAAMQILIEIPKTRGPMDKERP
jgi:hypothetical protein